MEHLFKLKEKDYTLYNDLIHSDVKITLKLDGKPFQITVNDKNEIEYRGRSGNTLDLGPLITNYDRLFSKPTNYAIEYFDKHKDLLNDYKFLVFEIVKDIIVLLYAVDKDNHIASDDNELYNISKKLGIFPVPVLFNGKLSETQINSINDLLNNLNNIKEKDFVNIIYNLFNEYKHFPKELFNNLDNIEGIVLNFYKDNKTYQYKIVDYSYTSGINEYMKFKKEEREKNKNIYENLYKIFVEYLNNNLIINKENQLDILNENFYNMLSDSKLFNKLFNLGAQLPVNNKETYNIQLDYTSQDIKNLILKYGDPIKTVYEEYVKLFKKPKVRAFVINKEFQQNINDIINKITN